MWGPLGRQREGFSLISARNSLALKLRTCITWLKKEKVRATLDLLNSYNEGGGSGLQSGGLASVGSPAGRAALSGAVAGVTRKEAKSELVRQVSAERRAQGSWPRCACRDTGLTEHGEEGTRDGQPPWGAGGIQRPDHRSAAFVFKDFISYNECGFLLLSHKSLGLKNI